jgi:hypothetical protein
MVKIYTELKKVLNENCETIFISLNLKSFGTKIQNFYNSVIHLAFFKIWELFSSIRRRIKQIENFKRSSIKASAYISIYMNDRTTKTVPVGYPYCFHLYYFHGTVEFDDDQQTKDFFNNIWRYIWSYTTLISIL